MRFFALLLIALAAPLAAGCGSESSGNESASAGQTIEISGSDFALKPATVNVDEAGSVTFKFTNDGKTEHALEIEGNGVEEETDTIGPGESAEVDVDLKDGEYEMYCPVDGHKKLGMEGKIVVGSGGGSGGATTDEMETDESETGETGDDDSGGGSGY